jgi:tellurite resistance protein
MDFIIPPAHLLPYGLRAMKSIAMANGTLDDAERSMLETGMRFMGAHGDLDAIEPIEPAELARHVTDPALRRQLIRGMTVLSLIDGDASPEEAELVERFAAALEVSSQDLQALRHLADGQLWRARFDIGRRFWARAKVEEFTRQKGLGWLARALAALAGLREDKATATRYRELGNAPPGSLGHSYFDFIVENEFGFPGEKGSPPEVIALHDLTHVLSGYGTDPEGEMQVLAFHTGCRREDKDPFSFLMFGLAQFHIGLRISPIAPGYRGSLDPGRVLRALQRGAACTIDPTDGWDPWPVMHRQLDELRTEYRIAPLEA